MDDINLGTLSHIVIGHDDSGMGAGWFLDDVSYMGDIYYTFLNGVNLFAMLPC